MRTFICFFALFMATQELSMARTAKAISGEINTRNETIPIEDLLDLQRMNHPARWLPANESEAMRELGEQQTASGEGKQTPLEVASGESLLADLTDKAAVITLKSKGATVVVSSDEAGQIQVRLVTYKGEEVEVNVTTNGEMSIDLTSPTEDRFVFESSQGNYTYARLEQGASSQERVQNSTSLSLGEGVNLSSGGFSSLNLSLLIQNAQDCSSSGDSAGEAEQANYDVALFNYDQHGDDWGDSFTECASGVQSPINLIQPFSKYGQSYEIFSFEEDRLRPEYWDLENAEVAFHKSIYSVEVYIDHNHGYAGFESIVGSKALGAPDKWDAVEFIFHHGSEHTIEGERFDLELQIIHTIHVEPTVTVENEATLGFNQARRQLSEEGENLEQQSDLFRRDLAGSGTAKAASSSSTQTSSDNFRYAIVSILFSVDNYSDNVDAEVHHEFDQFFEDLNFEEDDHVSETILFGELMRHIDWSHRWIYKGSLTVPPCSHSVYWNVIGTVYPIKKKVVEAFNKKLNRAGLDTTGLNGNYRNVNKALNLEVFYVLSRASYLGRGLLTAMSLLMTSLY